MDFLAVPLASLSCGATVTEFLFDIFWPSSSSLYAARRGWRALQFKGQGSADCEPSAIERKLATNGLILERIRLDFFVHKMGEEQHNGWGTKRAE